MLTLLARISPRFTPSWVHIVVLILLVLAAACGASDAPEEPGSSPSTTRTPAATSDIGNMSGDPTPARSTSGPGTTDGAASGRGENPTGTVPGSSSSATPAPASGGGDADTVKTVGAPVSASPEAVPIPTRTIPPEEATWTIQGVFPLHQAAFDGELSQVEALLDQGEPVGARAQIVSSAGETREVTPIELAVWNNTPPVVELLIEKGGAEQLRSEAHSTLALIAVQHNPDPGVMEVLLTAFADRFQGQLDMAVVQRGDYGRVARAWVVPCAVGITARYPEPVDRFLAFGWGEHLSGDVGGQLATFGLCQTNPESSRGRPQFAGLFSEATAKNPHPEVLQVFLDHGADVNRNEIHRGIYAINDEGYSYLHRAAQYNPEPAVAAALVDHGLDVNQTDGSGRTPLQLALMRNDEPSMAAFLIAKGADVNVDIEGRSHSWHPLWIEMRRNRVDAGLIRLLLEAGADPNVKDGDAILLHQVMGWDEPDLSEVVAILLEKGAQVNARDSIRMTALHLAMVNGYQAGKNPQVVKLLLDAGADVNAQDQRGETPLHLALPRAEIEVVRLLLEAGGDVNLNHPDGRSLLHLSVRGDPEEAQALAGMLLEAGADPDARGPNGDTLLHRSVNNPGVAELLLDGGADVDARNSNGLTALYLAIGRGGSGQYPGYPETVELLLAAGADPHADLGGRTPCQRARQSATPSPGGQRLLELACSP